MQPFFGYLNEQILIRFFMCLEKTRFCDYIEQALRIKENQWRLAASSINSEL